MTLKQQIFAGYAAFMAGTITFVPVATSIFLVVCTLFLIGIVYIDADTQPDYETVTAELEKINQDEIQKWRQLMHLSVASPVHYIEAYEAIQARGGTFAEHEQARYEFFKKENVQD